MMGAREAYPGGYFVTCVSHIALPGALCQLRLNETGRAKETCDPRTGSLGLPKRASQTCGLLGPPQTDSLGICIVKKKSPCDVPKL